MVDLVLVVCILLAALFGWRQGIITSGLAAAGWLVGLLFGLWVVPLLLERTELTPQQPATAALVVVLVTLVLAGVCAGITGSLGRRLVRATGSRAVRGVDSAAGAVALTAAMAVGAWAVPNSALPYLSAESADAVEGSSVWQALNRSMPQGARSAADDLTRRLQTSPFPEVFDYEVPQNDLPAPDASVTNNQAIKDAADSIVKVRVTEGCQSMSVGSGWVLSEHRVVTNAHVVAGADRLDVQVGDGSTRERATVVAFDPDLDLAVLSVPDLDAEPLPVAEAASGDDAVVAGYPRGGDYHLSAARVLSQGNVSTRNIYSSAMVTRDVLTMETTVVPGNSGGPVLTEDGKVAGTVFAKAADNSEVGFAVSLQGSESFLRSGEQADDAVNTGACLSEAA
ncbi:MarP family serine protease [Dermacoccaceae bacterium W4C1]